MSFDPKDELVRNQVLKVEELNISGSDEGLFEFNAGDCIVHIGEELVQIYSAECKVDSGNTVTLFAQASLIKSDSVSPFISGGDKKAIRVSGLAALAAGDCLTLKYSTKH